MSSRARKIFAVATFILLFIPGVLLICWKKDLSSIYLIRGDSRSGIRLELVVPIIGHDPILAHYAEHLAWLPNIGRNSRPADRDGNAWTNDYAVGYWISGPADDLVDMLQRLGVVFMPLNVDRKVAETERDIVIREYDMRLAEDIDSRAIEAMDAFLYEGNPSAASVLGTPKKIMNLSYDDARVMHSATHRPDLAKLVVFGDVSKAQLRRALKEANFPIVDVSHTRFDLPEFRLAAPKEQIFRFPDFTVSPRLIWRKVVSLPEPVEFDLLEAQAALASDILSSNLPGGFAGPLRFDEFVARKFEVSIVPLDEHHVEIVFLAEPDAGVSFAALRTAFEAALATSARGVPIETYSRIKGRFGRFWPDWSNTEETALWMADYVVARLSVLREPQEKRDIIRTSTQIEIGAIKSLIAALSLPGRTAIALIGTERTP